MVRLIKITILIFLISYIFLVGYIYLNQKSYVFFPSNDSQVAPEYLKVEDAYINTEDGERLHAWWMPINPEAKTVLFFHGNAGNLTWRVNQMKAFADLGLNALMIDYRGYGKSSGEIKNENDLYIDGKTAFEYLTREKGISEENIILWGRSLGGAVTIDLSQDKKLAAVIVESSLYSGLDLAREYYWFLPVKYLLKYHFESYKKIKNIHSPILIMHGLNDEVMPYEQGTKLFEAANEPKEFFELKGGHNTGLYETYDDYIAELKKFLKL